MSLEPEQPQPTLEGPKAAPLAKAEEPGFVSKWTLVDYEEDQKQQEEIRCVQGLMATGPVM